MGRPQSSVVCEQLFSSVWELYTAFFRHSAAAHSLRAELATLCFPYRCWRAAAACGEQFGRPETGLRDGNACLLFPVSDFAPLLLPIKLSVLLLQVTRISVRRLYFFFFSFHFPSPFQSSKSDAIVNH